MTGTPEHESGLENEGDYRVGEGERALRGLRSRFLWAGARTGAKNNFPSVIYGAYSRRSSQAGHQGGPIKEFNAVKDRTMEMPVTWWEILRSVFLKRKEGDEEGNGSSWEEMVIRGRWGDTYF